MYNVIILNKNYFLKRNKDLKVKREVRWSKAFRAATGAPPGLGHGLLLHHPERRCRTSVWTQAS